MFAKNSACAYPRMKWTAAMAHEPPPSIGHTTGPVVHFRTGTRHEGRMADGYSKEEVEAMVAKAVEKAMNGILMVAITETVHCAVTQAMKDYKHECLLDLDERELEAMQTMVDVVKSTGHGNIISGVEEIRENHTFVVKLRKRCEKAGETMTQTLVKGITGAVMLAMAIGVAYLLFKQTGNGGS